MATGVAIYPHLSKGGALWKNQRGFVWGETGTPERALWAPLGEQADWPLVEVSRGQEEMTTRERLGREIPGRDDTPH